jgi:hypothetical protein
MFRRIRRANQGGRPILDGSRKLIQVCRGLAKIVENFVDTFGIDVQRLIEPAGDVRYRRQ